MKKAHSLILGLGLILAGMVYGVGAQNSTPKEDQGKECSAKCRCCDKEKPKAEMGAATSTGGSSD